MKAFGLPKSLRLKNPNEFARVFERKRSASDERLIVYGCENGLDHLRLGLSVSRKVGGAVKRNRLRRLYREAFRLTRPELPIGIDLVLIPKSKVEPTLADLQASLRRLVHTVARRLGNEKQP